MFNKYEENAKNILTYPVIYYKFKLNQLVGKERRTAMEKYRDKALPVEERVKDLLERMTLEEKVAQMATCLYSDLVDDSDGCTSIREMKLSPEKIRKLFENGMGQVAIITACNKDPVDAAAIVNDIQKIAVEQTRLGIPVIFDAEGAVGLIARDSTHNPMPIGMAASFDPKLVEQMMGLAREQMKAVGVREVFAPVIDVTRDPRWGRLEETFGEDPYLVSQMGTAFIKGLQGEDLREGVASTAKHFLAYGLSEGGMNMSSCKLSERDIYEQAAMPFEAAVKEADIAGVMSSYNDIDGEPVTGSIRWCRSLLRDKWGFQGLLVQDAGAMPRLAGVQRVVDTMQEAGILGVKSGLDLELMSDCCFGTALIAAVRRGLVEEHYIDEACARHLTLKFRLGLFDNPYLDTGKVQKVFHSPERAATARRMAQESIVLLKNDNNILPLSREIGKLALIGPQADYLRGLFTNYSHIAIQDVFKVVAQDSLFANATDEYPIHGVTLKEGILAKLKASQMVCVPGCSMDSEDTDGIAEAVEAAKNADTIILAVGSVSGFLTSHNCGEARDSATLRLPGAQEALVKAVASLEKPIILILIGGRVFGIEDVYKKAAAAIEAWPAGEEGGNAIADVLFGDYNPAGRLPVSIPRAVGQVPVYYNHKCGGGRSMPHGSYTDMPCTPMFAFGHGLSYTDFTYSCLTLSSAEISGNETVEISCIVENSGKREGDEVVQLYLCDVTAEISRPDKELKGFLRIHLQSGEAKKVTFRMNISQMAYYDRKFRYVVEPGLFKVMVGAASDDIRLSGEFRLTGETIIADENNKQFFTEVSAENL